jgi:hypothetical protein
MRAEQRAHAQEERISMLQLIRSPTLRMPLLIAVVMQLSQQLSGINAVSLLRKAVSLIETKFGRLGNLSNPLFECFLLGVLLFHNAVFVGRVEYKSGKVRNDRDRSDNGGNDACLHNANGSGWPKDPPPVRPRGNVHLLYIHHHLTPHQGVSRTKIEYFKC